jgi:hypothetical protein
VDVRMGHAEHPCVLRDEAVELLAAGLEGSGEALLAGRRPTIEPTSSRMTSVFEFRQRASIPYAFIATPAYVVTIPSNCRERALRVFPTPGSRWMPTRAAASAHWTLRCSVGVTTRIRSIVRRAISTEATRKANVVLPAPGVATARKSCWSVDRYASSASCCHARNAEAVPQGARPG